MNEQEKLIAEQLKTLPPNLRQAIETVSWKALVQEVGKVNALDAEQITSLEQETMFIIYAFEPPEDYIANIVREVGISEGLASIIAESIAEKVFKPILEKSESQQKAPTPENLPVGPSVPEIAPEMHPAIESGETAHDVPRAEPTIEEQMKVPPPPPPPDYQYEPGKDPYREPIG